MDDFKRKREATIQFSDTFGYIPIMPSVTSPVDDIDSRLTAQVRNTNRFVDQQFSTGAWPAVGEYGVVLLEQLREQQVELKEKFSASSDAHPDIEGLTESLEKAVVAIVNNAPRRKDHHAKGQNGDDFYVGITKQKNEIYAQLPFFRAIHARGDLESLYRIPDDAGVWPTGEQFRSSVVSTARTYTDRLEQVSLDVVPRFERSLGVAFADKFGNVRLETDGTDKTLYDALTAASKRSQDAPLQEASLIVNGVESEEKVVLVDRLTSIPEDRLGVYFNPADPSARENMPYYIELARRVTNCNTTDRHAYAAVQQAVATALQQDVSAVTPDLLDGIQLEINLS